MSQSIEPPVEQTEQAVQNTGGIEKSERVVTSESGVEHRERTVRDVGAEHRQWIAKTSQVVWLFIGIVEIAVGLRIVLKAIGANPDNNFASFIYNFAGLFLSPFFGLIGSPSTGGMVLEIPSLIAMLVYALLGWVIAGAILPLFDRPTTRSSSTYDRTRN